MLPFQFGVRQCRVHARRVLVRSVCLVLAVLVIATGIVATQPAAQDSNEHLPATNAFSQREQQTNALLPRSIPVIGKHDESGDIELQADRELVHLTYPARSFPGDWRVQAQRHIQQHVTDSARLGGIGGATGSIQPVTTDSWNKVGPAPIDNNAASNGYKYGLVTGRMNSVAIDPTNGAIAYAGATAGGLWKTTTCCSATTTWTPLWDDKDFVTQAVGAIEIDPTNSNVVYAGTGDFDARDQYGVGVMKTTDAGATWTLLGGGPNGIFTPYNTIAHGPTGANPPPTENIGSIQVDPHNPNNVFVGAQFGFFMSRDAGTTWTQVDVADPTQAQWVTSIVIDPSTNPSTLYVALGYAYSTSRRPGVTGQSNGIYKATIPASGTPAFSLISTAANGWPTATGSCTSSCTVGRIRMAQSSQNPLLIYAQVSNYDINWTNALGTWITTNGGSTWSLLSGSTDSNYKDCNGNSTAETQDWYDLFLGVDPTNDHTLYIGRTSLYKATVDPTYSSMTITNLTNVYSQTCSSYGSMHPDQHAIAMRSDGSFLVGDDGGVYLGTGAAGGFTPLINGINTIQFYAGQVGANYAGAATQYAFGGAQDNGNESWTSANSDLKWQARGNGGDGFFTAFDPIAGSLNTGRWYTEYTYGALACSGTGATGNFSSSCQPTYGNSERADWSTPFTLDQLHCATTTCKNLILGTSVVHATGSGGMSSGAWTKISGDLTKGNIGGPAAHTLLDVRFAPSDPATAVVGSDDGNVQWSNNIYTGATCTQAAINTVSFSCTPNAAATWVNLTQNNASLPNRTILGVGVKADDNQTVYAAVGGFNTNTPATPGHLFQATCTASCTSAGNWSWSDKTGNLPDVPAATVLSNPLNPTQVFVGTFFGFYYTNDITAASPTWLRFQTGLPNTVIQYLTVDRGSTTLAAFTFGRGLYTIQLPSSGGFGGGATATPTTMPPTATPTTTATATSTATTMPTPTSTDAPPTPTPSSGSDVVPEVWIPFVEQLIQFDAIRLLNAGLGRDFSDGSRRNRLIYG